MFDSEACFSQHSPNNTSVASHPDDDLLLESIQLSLPVMVGPAHLHPNSLAHILTNMMHHNQANIEHVPVVNVCITSGYTRQGTTSLPKSPGANCSTSCVATGVVHTCLMLNLCCLSCLPFWVRHSIQYLVASNGHFHYHTRSW